MAINGRIRTMASDFRGYSHQLQFLFGAGAVTNEILSSVDKTWTVKRMIVVDFARAVIAVGPPDSRSPAAVIKISRNSDAARNMDRNRSLLQQVRSDPRLTELRPILPEELAWGRIGDQTFLVEKALPGTDARNLLDEADRCARMQAAALETVAVLHERTARTVTVDRNLTRRWIDEPVRRIRGLKASYPRIALYEQTMADLAQTLTDDLIGRRMAVSWLHGDFFPGNILVSPDGGVVSGLVDWDLAAPDELPVLDAMQLLIGIHLVHARSELGPAVRVLLSEGGFTAGEVDALTFAQSRLGGDSLTFREAVLLTWLRHIACNLTKSAHFSRHRWWIRANVEGVLESLDRGGIAS
jgi:aminoglycoside phosphotransferase